MKVLTGLLLVFSAFVWGAWYWRRQYQPSPLEIHLADLQARTAIGTIVNRQQYSARPAFTTMGAGILTGTRINPNNPASISNRPGRIQLYTQAPNQP